MVKPAFVDKDGVKKGAWNEEEDYKLRAYIQRFGHWNWGLLPKYAGLARSGKSCRLRWVNYLKPGVKRGSYSKEEVDLIMKLHAELGNKWSAIAEKLPGRTDNSIKNYWHAHVKKRNRRNAAATNQIKQQLCETSQLSEILHEQRSNLISSKANIQSESSPKDFVVAESSYLQALDSLVPPLNNTTCVVHDVTITGDLDEGNFWSELCQISYLESSTKLNYDDLLFVDPYIMSPQGPQHWLAENSIPSSDAVAETQENFWTEPEGGLFSPSFLYCDDN